MTSIVQLTATDGFQFPAYVAQPPGQPLGAIVVLQEIFGVNAHIRAVADGYAAQGYVAIAPSTFHRVKADVELGYGPDDVAAGAALKAAVEALPPPGAQRRPHDDRPPASREAEGPFGYELFRVAFTRGANILAQILEWEASELSRFALGGKGGHHLASGNVKHHQALWQARSCLRGARLQTRSASMQRGLQRCLVDGFRGFFQLAAQGIRGFNRKALCLGPKFGLVSSGVQMCEGGADNGHDAGNRNHEEPGGMYAHDFGPRR